MMPLIRVIGSIELEVPTKMLRNLSEKLVGEFASTSLGSSMVNIFCLDGTFSEILELQASPVEGQQLQQKDKKRRKRKSEKKEKRKALSGRALSNLQTLPFAHTRAKMLVERKACLLLPSRARNVKKTRFFHKPLRVNVLTI